MVNEWGLVKAKRRIKAELKQMADDSQHQPLINWQPDADDDTLVHVLIEGRDDTPYAGGFFYFTVRFPDDYPINPPAVRLQTTDSGRVSFNPIFNKEDGWVSLNILERRPGRYGDAPCWCPKLGLCVVLLSIQSMLNEEPWYNEMDYEDLRGRMSEESRKYNERVEYEVLRVAVIGMLENGPDAEGMPKMLRDVMVKRFRINFEKYANRLDWIRVSQGSDDDNGVDNRWFWQRWWSKKEPAKELVEREEYLGLLKDRLMKLKAELIG